MRMIALVAIALAGMSLTSTFADAGTWCGTYRRGQYKLRLFLVRGMLGHGARLWGILPTESIPRDGLRDLRRELETPDSPKHYRRAY